MTNIFHKYVVIATISVSMRAWRSAAAETGGEPGSVTSSSNSIKFRANLDLLWYYKLLIA